MFSILIFQNLVKYDYSDDEDDKKDEEEEDPFVPLTDEERFKYYHIFFILNIFRTANNLVDSKEVQDELMRMHKERMDALNQVFKLISNNTLNLS